MIDIDARDFGFVADGNAATAGDNAVALQAAITAGSAEFGTGFDTGGGGGARVCLPRGTAYIGDMITVHDGVEVFGQGTYGTVLRMPSWFSTTQKFIRLGTEGSQTAIAASQSLGAAGNLSINGQLSVSGVGTFIQKRRVAVYSTGNNSSVNFTITGTAGDGSAQAETIAGPNNGFAQTQGYFKTVTQVSCNNATVGNVSTGMETVASFGSRLSNLQLFSANGNAALNAAMVYSDNAQHTGGIKGVKIFGGNRVCAFFEKGIGGASYFTFEDVETFNLGSVVAANNPQIIFNYAGLLTRASNIVCAGPGTGPGGSGAKGLVILGGFVELETFHPEGVYTGIYVSIPTINEGAVSIKHVLGNPDTPRLVHLDLNVDNNTVLLSNIFAGGSSVTVKDDPGGTSVTGNILAPTLF